MNRLSRTAAALGFAPSIVVVSSLIAFDYVARAIFGREKP